MTPPSRTTRPLRLWPGAALAAGLLCLAATPATGIGPDRTAHIAGGEPAAGARHEALVLVSYPQGSGVAVSECTGAVVGQRWVATAAHCLTRAGAGGRAELRDGLQTRVIVARANIGSVREARREDAAEAVLDAADALNAIRGEAYGIPPGYRPRTSRNGDVALIRLDRRVNSALGVPLARPDQARALRPGGTVTVSGWGDTGNGVRSSVLKSAELSLLDDSDCSAATGTGSLFTFVPGAMVCGGDSTPPAAGACGGDSGGPLVSRTRAGYRLLVGVVSFGDVSCGGGPSFFTRVDAFNGFLGSLMDADPVAGVSDPQLEDAVLSDVGETGARLSADVDPNGAVTALEVDYSPIISPVSRTAGVVAGTGRVPVGATTGLPGLAPGTTYDYSTWASSVLGRRPGPSGRFRTPGRAREPRIVEARIRCAPATPRPRAAANGSVELTVDQLVINQRIGQAALRRVEAIEKWLDDGITSRDVCGASLGPRLFDGVTQRDALRIEPGSPDPRDLQTRRLGPAQPGRFRLNRRQLIINQRIYQAALRKARAVRRRVEGGLTGGDIVDGALRREHLAPGAIVTAVADRPAPAPSRSEALSAPPRAGGVRVDERQLRINQRIAQAAIRETRRVIGRLEIGLEGKNFRRASITAADLRSSVTNT